MPKKLYRVLACSTGTLLLLQNTTFAFDAICGDNNSVTHYRQSVDPSQVTQPTCFVIPENNTQAQRDFVLHGSVPVVLTNGSFDGRKARVVAGLGVAKSQAEIDAVTASDAALAAQNQQYQDELNNNDLCNSADFATIDTRIDTLVATITNTCCATTRSALTTALKKIAKCFISFRNAH